MVKLEVQTWTYIIGIFFGILIGLSTGKYIWKK
jgi:hypothetical protein